MTGSVNVGLGVTSHNTGRDSIGYFDNFLLMPTGLSAMSESWTPTATGIDTSLPTAWTSGTYGLALRDTVSGVYQANTFDYDPCIDTTLSSISVHSGATVGGSSVSLANLFDYTGNVGGFSYEIDGSAVNNPWNSFASVSSGATGIVTLKVTGTDPDCGGTVYTDAANITVDNTCSDPTPSTITILTGQVVGGSSVDLTQLYSSTGNVADNGLTFKIDGVVVGDPTNWDSRQFGATESGAVSFEVSGLDPDCGNGITAVNTLLIDNSCTRNFPSISFDEDVKHVGAGRAVPYTVTIRNEDSPNCGPSIFNISVLSDSNGSDFVPSYFNPPGSNIDISLQGRESVTFEVAVEATAGAVEWNQNLTTLQIDSNYPSHNTPKTEGSVTTKVFLVSPITHNSVTTGSTKWGSNWGTTQIGSKYGNFDCLTCHSKTGTEIKWMRGTISTPDGSNWAGPGSPDVTIRFKDARSSKEIEEEGGNAVTDVYWGHDDPNLNGSGHASSDRVCEVCHSETMYHRYNTAGQDPATLVTNETHFPSRDCTDCHRHSLGFTADCTGCHGDPPLTADLGGPNGLADIPAPTGSVTPGTHYKHTVVLGFECEYCHAGWRDVGEMPKEIIHDDPYDAPDQGPLPYQDINHLFNVFFDQGMTDPTKDAGHYTGQDGVSYEGVLIEPGQGTMTCENIYCHGGTETMGGSNPQWNGNIACNSCHGTSATDTPPGYSHTTHVGKMDLECTVCHYTGGQDAGYNGHVNGRVNLEMNTPAWQALTPMYDPTPGDGGVGAVVTYNSNLDGSDMPPSAQYGSCLNVACHYGNETPPWNNNDQPATCTTCHNDGTDDGLLTSAAPSSGWHEEHVHPTMAHADKSAAEIATHERMIGAFVNGCESCHGGGSNTGEHPGHVNQQADLGGGMTFSEASQTCTSQCHSLGGIDTKGTASIADDTPLNLTWAHNTDYTLACESCHSAPYLGPTVVDPDAEGVGINVPTGGDSYGSHLRTVSGQVLNQATEWTTQCRYCHPYHGDEGLTSYAEVPLPDTGWDQLGDGTNMGEKLGLQFPVSGSIHLGGTGTTGTTEAQICWNCHDSQGISEWGTDAAAHTNTEVDDPSGNNYNYGSVTSSNWTSATWTSGYAGFTYKTAAIQSTHAANVSAVAGETSRSGVDDVGGIRCTYCHDVHDRNKALTDVANGTYETLTGYPYLRGSWMRNPYKEDGAPQSGTTYTNYNTENYGQVPRGSSNPAQQMGGYWIDQNSGDPVSGSNYDQFGGICQLCHGSDINTLNQYGANGAGWVSGLNGHANSVKGGSGVGGNIYTATDRGGGSTNNYNGHMGYWNYREPGDGGGGMRGGDGDSFNITPGVDGYGNEPCANDGGSCNGGTYESDWDNLRAFDVTGATNNSGYHTFSCSKCHNPHASRLPKLMITNCLDTKHNSWDDNIQAGTGGPTVTDNVTAAAWTTAQNCHRLAGINDPQDGNDANQNSQGSGWNLVTPWTDPDTYGPGNGTNPSQDNSGTW
jgi:predicted CxxxxCH...CXXCH cytochrome family protein